MPQVRPQTAEGDETKRRRWRPDQTTRLQQGRAPRQACFAERQV